MTESADAIAESESAELLDSMASSLSSDEEALPVVEHVLVTEDVEKIERELATLSTELEHSVQASAQPAEFKPLLWRAKAVPNDLMNCLLELDGVSVSAQHQPKRKALVSQIHGPLDRANAVHDQLKTAQDAATEYAKHAQDVSAACMPAGTAIDAASADPVSKPISELISEASKDHAEIVAALTEDEMLKAQLVDAKRDGRFDDLSDNNTDYLSVDPKDVWLCFAMNCSINLKFQLFCI